VLASIFSHDGGYGSGASFVEGLGSAIYVGAAVVAVGSLSALAIRRVRREPDPVQEEVLTPVLDSA
jgi:hypothetical protein